MPYLLKLSKFIPTKRVSRLRRTPSTTSLPIGLGQDLQSKKGHKRTNSNSTQFSIGSLDLCPGGENGETKSLHSLAGAITEMNDDAFSPPSEHEDQSGDDFADATRYKVIRLKT